MQLLLVQVFQVSIDAQLLQDIRKRHKCRLLCAACNTTHSLCTKLALYLEESDPFLTLHTPCNGLTLCPWGGPRCILEHGLMLAPALYEIPKRSSTANGGPSEGSWMPGSDHGGTRWTYTIHLHHVPPQSVGNLCFSTISLLAINPLRGAGAIFAGIMLAVETFTSEGIY